MGRPVPLDFLDNLYNVLVIEGVVFAHLLRLVLDRGPPHQSVLELLEDGPVDLVAKVLQGAPGGLQDHWRRVVRQLALGLGVDPHQSQVLPHLFQQRVVVPLVMGRDGHAVRDFADDILQSKSHISFLPLEQAICQAYFLADFPATADNRISEKFSFSKNFEFLALSFQFLLEFLGKVVEFLHDR